MENPWMEKPWQATVHEVLTQRVRNGWATNTHTDTDTRTYTDTGHISPALYFGEHGIYLPAHQKPALCFMKRYHFYLSISLERQSGRKGS